MLQKAILLTLFHRIFPGRFECRVGRIHVQHVEPWIASSTTIRQNLNWVFHLKDSQKDHGHFRIFGSFLRPILAKLRDLLSQHIVSLFIVETGRQPFCAPSPSARFIRVLRPRDIHSGYSPRFEKPDTTLRPRFTELPPV